jgi:phenylacetate-CoA oxygenase PaaI subunit
MAGESDRALANLVRSLADNKQLLGMRYAEWCTAAPTLEADIAAAAMGLDDIGHSRVLYGCVQELGGASSLDRPGEYASVPYLDRPWTDWKQFVAANAVLDTAFTLVVEALSDGNVEVLRARLRKMLQEERYHFLFGHSWLSELDAGAALDAAWREAVEWLGPEGGDIDRLKKEGKIAAGVTELRDRFRDRANLGAASPEMDFKDWDPVRRRRAGGAIDQATAEMLRGLAERRFMPVESGAATRER